MEEQVVQEIQQNDLVDINSSKLETFINQFPVLEFDNEDRESAREQLSQNPNMTTSQRIELVLRNGLFEEYPNIEELYMVRKMDRYLQRLSKKEDGAMDVEKLKELKNFYWKNFLYPLITSYILENDIEPIQYLSMMKFYSLGEVIPVYDRVLLASLVSKYKASSEIEKTKIKNSLKNKLGDYYWNNKTLKKGF